MELKIELNGDSGILHMTGDLTVRRGDDIRSGMISVLKSIDHIIVNIKKPADIDITCLQLLCSVCRTAASMGKKIEFSKHTTKSFKDISTLSGFQRSICCTDNCLWKCDDYKEI